MKKVLFTMAALLVSVSAHAVHQGSSWSEIFASRHAVVTHGYALGGIKLENACMTDTEIRSITPTRECAELVPRQVGNPNSEQGGYTEWVCARYETTTLAVSRSYEQPVCEEFTPANGEQTPECTRFGSKIVTVPRTIDTQVIITRGEADQSFWKRFTFPTCEGVYPH